MSRPDDEGVAAGGAPAWLRRFHDGETGAMDDCYRRHFAAVDRAVARVLVGADRETVVHELFYRILSRPDLRATFQGGSLAAWLSTLARNQAIDFARKHGRERPAGGDLREPDADEDGPARLDEALEARRLVARFRQEVLPPKWEGVFLARFMEELDQKEAARRLGMRRTTLAYQEYRIRRLLHRFVLKGAAR